MKSEIKQSVINHVALVLDGSGSMTRIAPQVIEAADGYVAHLARRSKEQDQETRVSVYVFEDARKIVCHVFDRDVLRLPSIKGLYRTQGQTPLIDATLLSIKELETTSVIHGDHSFLVVVLTDGEENASINSGSFLNDRLRKLPENWTVACFVPNIMAKREAQQFGFPTENIAVWDASSARGVQEFGEKLSYATDNYLTARGTGMKGTRNLFSMNLGALDTRAVQQQLDRIAPNQFRLYPVHLDEPIAKFVERQTGRPYKIGEAFYQLTKPVDVQGYKGVAIYSKAEHAVYTGENARRLLNLPDHQVRLAPDFHPDYDIFIQSTSVNRKLLAGTRLLLLSPGAY